MNWYTDRLPYARACLTSMCVFINKCLFGMQTAISRCAQCLRRSNAKKASMFSYFELCIYTHYVCCSRVAGTLWLALNWYWYGDVAPASTLQRFYLLLCLYIFLILFIYTTLISNFCYIIRMYEQQCVFIRSYMYIGLYRNQFNILLLYFWWWNASILTKLIEFPLVPT